MFSGAGLQRHSGGLLQAHHPQPRPRACVPRPGPRPPLQPRVCRTADPELPPGGGHHRHGHHVDHEPQEIIGYFTPSLDPH